MSYLTDLAGDPRRDSDAIVRDHRTGEVYTRDRHGNKVVDREETKEFRERLKERQDSKQGPEKFVSECKAAGMPPDLVKQCAQARAQGIPMEALKQAANQAKGGGGGPSPMTTGPRPAASPGGGGPFGIPTTYLIVGGVAAAGLVGFLLWRA